MDGTHGTQVMCLYLSSRGGGGGVWESLARSTFQVMDSPSIEGVQMLEAKKNDKCPLNLVNVKIGSRALTNQGQSLHHDVAALEVVPERCPQDPETGGHLRWVGNCAPQPCSLHHESGGLWVSPWLQPFLSALPTLRCHLGPRAPWATSARNVFFG